MRKMVEAQQKLVPDLLRVMRKRYEILRQIRLSGKTGRRTLAASVHLTERSLRTELDTLREQGLVEIAPSGMALSAEGERLLEELEPFVREWFGLTRLEEALREAFALQRVIVVPGDSDDSDAVKQEVGRAAARVLAGVLRPGDVVAVMGGTTMACVASQMQSSAPLRDNWFVPARGGLGESVDVQASTIASEMAKRTGARYRMLHVPDHLGEEAYQTMMQEPNVREVVEMIRNARIVVHGIGEAMTMARRRKLDERTMEELRREGAVAEAFGYYFDRSGAVVHRMATIGLRLQDLEKADTVIGVAGGRSKGEAIAAVLLYGQNDILITDEAAATEALKTREAG